MLTRTTAPAIERAADGGRASLVPSTETGRIGRPISIARLKPPFLKGKSSPVLLRVPSGAMKTLKPCARIDFALSKLATARARLLRSTEMNPAASIAAPNTGTRKSSFFATMRMLPPSTW